MTTSEFVPADRVRRIRESPSSAAANRVRNLRAEGVDIIDFTIGEPDFDTPDVANEAGIAAIREGRTKYTPVNGTVELRDAIRHRVIEKTGQNYSDAEITVGGGGKQLLYLALSGSLNSGDEVIVPAPYWVSYPDMVLANDGTPVIVETTAASGYKITPDLLRGAVTDRTRWLVLNTPNNPTGAVYSARELRALADELARHPHVRILTDEIYDEILYTDEPFSSLVEVAPELRSRIVTVNGASKAYAMTGWRLGYAYGDAGVVAAINKLQSQSSSCPSSISQAAAAAALMSDQSFVAETVTAYRERRDVVLGAISAIDGLVPVRPDGAFYLFVDCSGLLGRLTPDGDELASDDDVVAYLINTAHVATIPGAAYGASPFFRMSFATSLGEINRGMAAISDAVKRLA